MNRLRLRRAALIALTTLLPCSAAYAAPTVVPYAGYLTDADGLPYEGGADVKATLYPCDGGETCDLVYEEAQPFLGLTVTGGVLAFELGADEGSTLAEVLSEGSDLWLEIELRLDGAATWTTLTPRHRLLSVPYAVSAHDADQLGGMDAADYATLAEIATHVTLEEIAAAGFIDEEDLIQASYVTTEVLNDYVTQAELDTYATTDSLTAYVKFDGLSTTLGNYVQTAALLPYIDQEELSEALAIYAKSTDISEAVDGLLAQTDLDDILIGYIQTDALESLALKADAYTNEDAVAAVTEAGFLGEEDLYTDTDVLALVDVEGYAKLADIPTHGITTTASTSSITLASDITDEKTVTLSFPVAAKIAKQHIRVDLLIRTELSLDYMDYGLTPPLSVAAEVTHNVHLQSGFADPPLYTDRLIQSPPREPGDSTTKGDVKQYSYFFNLSEDELNEGAVVEIALTAKCYAVPAETNIGCGVYVGLERITISGY